MAAIRLLGEFGKHNHLKEAAAAALSEIVRYTDANASNTNESALRIDGVLDLVLPDKRDEVVAALSVVRTGANVSSLVGRHAQAALLSLGRDPSRENH